MSAPILSIKNLILNHQYDQKTAIHVDELLVNKGDIVFINGKNGSGKSTLLNYLFTANNKPKYVKSNEGQFKIDYHLSDVNQTYTSEQLINQNIVYLSQKNPFVYKESIEKTLIRPTRISVENSNFSKHEKKIMLDKAKKLARFLLINGVSDGSCLFMDFIEDFKFYQLKTDEEKESYALKRFKRIYSDELSGGQSKLVAFLSAYIKVKVFNSELMILDEPLNNLDFSKIQKVCCFIDELFNERQDHSLTLIIVSHLMIFPLIHHHKAVQYEIDSASKKLIPSKQKIDHSKILMDW
jgi:ABC-type lipoprotein export system ATPase subunit